MAAIFQTIPGGGLTDTTKDKPFMATFFSKKKKAQPAIAPAPPSLPQLSFATPPAAPPPSETPVTMTASKDPAPSKTVRKQPSDVDDDLRQHLKREGISFLAFADFGEVDATAPPPKQQTEKASSSDTKAKGVGFDRKEEAVPKETLRTVHDFYAPRTVAPEIEPLAPAAPAVPISTDSNRPQSAAPVTYPQVSVTHPTLTSPARPVTASSAKSSTASTLKALFKREGIRKGRALKTDNGNDKKDGNKNAVVNGPPASAPNEIPVTAESAPCAPPQYTVPERSTPVVKVSPPATQPSKVSIEDPIIRDGDSLAQPSISAVGSTITVEPSVSKLQKPEHARPSNRQSPPSMTERRSPDLNRPARDSGKFMGQKEVEVPKSPTKPTTHVHPPPESFRSDAASSKSDSETTVHTTDPTSTDTDRVRNAPDLGALGPNHASHRSPRGSWRGPPPEMVKRRTEQRTEQMNGNLPIPAYGRGYGPPPDGFSQRRSQAMSNGPVGYFPPHGDGYPNGNRRSSGNGYANGARFPRSHGPPPNRRSKPPQPATESKEDLPTEHNSSNPSDDSETPASSTEDLRKNFKLPVPVMLPPGNVYTPSVTDIQRYCGFNHRSTVLCSNIHHRIQCMVCLTDAASERYVCSYCALRFCARCKDEFSCGTTFDQVSERAQAEDWASQAVPSSPSRPSGVNMAWETACALDTPNRPRGPPRLREPPYGRRPYPRGQKRPNPRGEVLRFDNSPSSGSRSSSPIRRRPEHESKGEFIRERPASSSYYDDDNRESDFEGRRRFARNMMGGGRNGMPVSPRNLKGYIP